MAHVVCSNVLTPKTTRSCGLRAGTLRTGRRIRHLGWRRRDDFASPTVRRRELGAALRRLRMHLGLTVDEVAGGLDWSATKISRIETDLSV